MGYDKCPPFSRRIELAERRWRTLIKRLGKKPGARSRLTLKRNRSRPTRKRPASFDGHALFGACARNPDDRAALGDPLRARNGHGLGRAERQERCHKPRGCPLFTTFH